MSTATFGNRIVTGFLCMLLAACGGNGSNLPGTAIASNTAVSQTTATTGGASANMGRLDTGSGAMQIPLVGQANATQARFNNPFGIARDVVGNLYVADHVAGDAKWIVEARLGRVCLPDKKYLHCAVAGIEPAHVRGGTS
ncbi:MAG TPA: hypothetical protein VM571_08730, partial [Noviherbaspirillum sp.]|nr:hypothetical protein [Noviherbaspirillum sp.]